MKFSMMVGHVGVLELISVYIHSITVPRRKPDFVGLMKNAFNVGLHSNAL